MTDHLADLAEGWTVWRMVGLRGAGFPAAGVHDLAARDAATAADAMLAARTLVDAARAATAIACEYETRHGAHGKLAGAAWKQSKKRAPAAFDGASPALVAVFAAQATAEQALAAARERYASALDADALAVATRLRGWAGAPAFREAVLWQNRAAVHTGLDRLGAPSATANSPTRKHERLVASYLQRYCVKNDSIGFFGPIGWATFGDTTRLLPGRRLVATRRVYFEYWGIAHLADQLAAMPGVREALPPRRMPTVTVTGTTLRHPIDRTSELPIAFARLLAACDGQRSARAIAAELVRDPSLELTGIAEVYELLDELVAQKLVTWRIELPTTGAPEVALRAALAAVDEPVRSEALARLSQLEAARDHVAAVSRDVKRAPAARVEALAHALAALDTTFTTLTATDATRNAGQAYAARTLVYEDCRRDAIVDLGADLRARLAAPLALLLASARWFTYEVAARYRAALAAAHRELGGEDVDYIKFWTAVEPLFDRSRGATAIVAAVVAELQQRWARILGERTRVTAAELRPAVHAQFAAPHPGWPSARHHAPDIMIAGALEAPQFVLGELHIAMNTLFVPPFLAQHPEPKMLVDAMHADLPRPRVTSVGHSQRVTRAEQASLARTAIDFEIGGTKSARPRKDVIAIGELIVQLRGEQLCVRTRDGRHTFDIIEFLDQLLVEATLGQFRMLPPVPHGARVTIDDVVVSRERWRFAPADVAFAAATDAAERFVGARAFARDHGLPRCVFYKVPEEPKPLYLDFTSPMYVESFARVARGASRIDISEMLPAVEACWLADAEGNRYTSELRIAAVDPLRWRPRDRVAADDPEL